MEQGNLVEQLYVLYNQKTGVLFRANTFSGGSFRQELKTWKTLNGAVKYLEKVRNNDNLVVKKLSVTDINV